MLLQLTLAPNNLQVELLSLLDTFHLKVSNKSSVTFFADILWVNIMFTFPIPLISALNHDEKYPDVTGEIFPSSQSVVFLSSALNEDLVSSGKMGLLDVSCDVP
jgi:hypothetical protein